MKKLVIIAVFLSTVLSAAISQTVGVGEISQIIHSNDFKLFGKNVESLKTLNDSTLFLINLQSGFYILSANIKAPAILAYSFKNSYEPNPAVNDFLQYYSDQLVVLKNQHEKKKASIFEIKKWLSNAFNDKGVTSEVEPLLNTTWNQNWSYNQYCPYNSEGPGNHTYAGCVATAMVQIMKYWEWPETGVGSSTYDCDYGTLSVDFSQAFYDYSLMPNHSSNEDNALLMYNAGVAVEMDYGPDGSGASSVDAMDAFTDHFQYSNEIDYVDKDDYSNTSWKNLLKNELNNGRPMYYRGSSATSAHAFVCDGYEDDYFHFNWGWGGNSDGFFLLNDLTPGSHNYNYNQRAIISIFPDDSSSDCDEFEPNNSFESAYDNGNASSFMEEMCLIPNDNDYFKLEYQGEDYYVRVKGYNSSVEGPYGLVYNISSDDVISIGTYETENNEETDTYLYLYDSNENILAEDDDSGQNTFSYLEYDFNNSGIDIYCEDLQISDNSIDIGESYDIAVGQCFSGTTTTEINTTVKVFLSDTPDLSGSENHLIFESDSDLDNDDHCDTEGGDFITPTVGFNIGWIVAKADANNEYDEQNEQNIIAIPVTIYGNNPSVDFYIDNLQISNGYVFNFDDTLNIEFQQYISGNSNQDYFVNAGVFISENINDWQGGNYIFVGSCVSSLNSNDDLYDNEDAQFILGELDYGTYLLIVEADYDQQFDETDEQNFSFIQFEILNTAPIPNASIVASPGCSSGVVTISSDLPGPQEFCLSDNQGNILMSSPVTNCDYWNFAGLVSGSYRGKILRSGQESDLTDPVSLVNLEIPDQTSAINGLASPCQGNQENYSVSSTTGVTYNWIVPSDWNIISEQGSYSITVIVGSDNGEIKVTPSNTCGNGPERTLNVTVETSPSQPSVITGETNVCEYSSEIYSVDYISGITYTWTVPSDYNIESGQGTNSITVLVGTTDGEIAVIPSNDCGNGQARVLSVNSASVFADAGADQTISYGQSAQLEGTASSDVDFTINWSSSNSSWTSDIEDPITEALTTTTEFTFIVTNEYECVAFDATTVFVEGDAMSLTVFAEPETICEGEIAQLNANVMGGTGEYIFNWTSDPEGFYSSDQNPTVSPYATTTYILEVTDGIDTISDQINIMVNYAPPTPPIPTGETYIDLNETTVSLYSVETAENVEYEFDLLPQTCYNLIDVLDNQIVVQWNQEYQGQAYLFASYSNSCGSESSEALEIIIDNTVGLNDTPTRNQIRNYPNPANDFIYIEKPESLEIHKIRLLDINGKLLMKQTPSSQSIISIPVNHYSSGVYLIEIISNNEVYRFKHLIK